MKEALSRNPELKSVVGLSESEEVLSLNKNATSEEKKSTLKLAFTSLMTREKEAIEKNLNDLISRLKGESTVS